jgi:hypothetical protein
VRLSLIERDHWRHQSAPFDYFVRSYSGRLWLFSRLWLHLQLYSCLLHSFDLTFTDAGPKCLDILKLQPFFLVTTLDHRDFAISKAYWLLLWRLCSPLQAVRFLIKHVSRETKPGHPLVHRFIGLFQANMLSGCLQPIQVTGLIRAYLLFSVDRITFFRVRLRPATADLLRLGAPYTAITRVLLPEKGVTELLIVTGIGLME